MHYGRNLSSWEITDFDLEYYPVWVRTPAHTEPVMTPLYCEFWYGLMVGGIRRAADYISLPTTKGYFWKLHNGHGYLTRAIPSAEEVSSREKVYRGRVAEVIEDPYGYADRIFAQFDELMVPFVDMKPDEMTNGELIGHIYDITNLHQHAIYLYFVGWFGITPLPGLFQQLAGELAGLKATDPAYSQIARGADNPLYSSNRAIADLARLAIDIGVGGELNLADAEVIPAMRKTEAGRRWMQALDEFIEVHGWKLMRMYEFCEPGWYEDPSLLIADIRRYAELGGVHRADEERARLNEERDTASAELLAKVPEAQREWMEKLLVCTQAANYWSEGAAWHGEFKRMAFGRRCFVECGKRMASAGVINEIDDIWMLFSDEIISALANGEKGRYTSLVAERRAEWEGYKALTYAADGVPPFLGDPGAIPDMLRLDPTLSVSISSPTETPEQAGATCTGGAGSPGLVEGIARVIMDEKHWGELQTGDIMICPMTSATWTPLFGMIKGLVCDSGGSLSHPVIVSREYGIPAVVGCGDATRKIKTGDRVRIDGDLLRVYVLD